MSRLRGKGFGNYFYHFYVREEKLFMKRISQQSVLRAVFAKVYGREFQAGVMDDRVMMQKAVFLLREFGVSCGEYDFVWDYYGPFSPDLSDDMKKEDADDSADVEFSQKAEKVMESLADAFSKWSAYSMRYWAEAIASLRYLKVYMYPSSSDEIIINKLEELKKDKLTNHSENLRAMGCLQELFAR